MIAINKNEMKLFFALLRSAITGKMLTDEEKNIYSEDILPLLIKTAEEHDILNILVSGLRKNELAESKKNELEKAIFKAVYRYRQLIFDYDKLCHALEDAKIPFIPLKGSVIRKYYPEPWMRTSCDIDVLINHNDIEAASSYLVSKLNYIESGRSSHDISFYTPQKIHIELHYDLVEEGRANLANEILNTVWDNVSPCDGYKYRYEMTDEFFYFYHIAHMAKHFEVGGCGIRPYIDLLLLDNIEDASSVSRNEILKRGELLKFANASQKLSGFWFLNGEADEIVFKMQNYIICGGVFGSVSNRVALQQQKKGGRFRYIISRVFIPYSKLSRYYPILEKHKWLMPIMQIRRWFMLLKPDVAARTKKELATNKNLDKSTANEMNKFLSELGLK